MVGTTAAAAAPTGSGPAGRRVSEKRGEREGEGPDAGAEQGVRPAQDDAAVGACRHQAVQVGHASVGHHVHSASEFVAGSLGATGRRRPGDHYHGSGRRDLFAAAKLRLGKSF